MAARAPISGKGTMMKKKAGRRPAIHMIDSEAETLANMAVAAEERIPQVSELLLEEIDRATLYKAARIPADVVTMHSHVEFVDEANGTSRTVQLVYPKDADIDAGRVSILTLVGAGLIGLREGQSILWPGRDGHRRLLTITRVSREAEAA
jgi:regulator of nucleoside diphosphate kinase|nr:nucleoside diphosphate kinase regulator [Rhizorhabdus wittichii]